MPGGVTADPANAAANAASGDDGGGRKAEAAAEAETRAFECAMIANESGDMQRAPLARHELERDAALEEPQHAVGGWIDFAIGVAVDDGHVQVLAPSIVETSLMVAAAELPVAAAGVAEDNYDDDDDDDYDDDDEFADGGSEDSVTGSVKAARDLLDALVCTKQRRMRLLGVSVACLARAV